MALCVEELRIWCGWGELESAEGHHRFAEDTVSTIHGQDQRVKNSALQGEEAHIAAQETWEAAESIIQSFAAS